MNLQEFYDGNVFDAYKYFGAHVVENGVVFRVYAPHARGVALIGDFNNWRGESMKQEANGIYTAFTASAKPGMLYKYRIYGADGSEVEHADPYGFGMELRPKSASVIVDLGTYSFEDEAWLGKREAANRYYNEPMNIYEVHLGSWRTNPNNENGWYSYTEIADRLIDYVKREGYTHIEFLPLSEHPADCSWGYQITGFFSPTSRYGTASELKQLIDACHKAEIGVIMDFVPVHFATDFYGLARFDGSPLYEYPNNDVGKSQWGSYNFIHSRGDIRSFIQSAANFWLNEFHFDGLRMDAISNALYWMGDSKRGVNGETVKFIKNMNAGLHRLNPGTILIAEDSSSFLKVTAPVEYDGLGFDYKWDMGWMNDTLDFFKMAPEYRPMHYHKLTFSMHYFYNELFLLPFSHDEVVHGKATIVQKMWGLYDDKFKQAKALYTYMFTHPGKKLNFMGNEIGQLREWDETREQDWDMLKYPKHDSFHEYIKRLCKIYKESPALYADEYNKESFRWLEVNAMSECVYIYERRARGQRMIVALNLSNKGYDEFLFGIDDPVKITQLINSDQDIYGGETILGEAPIEIMSHEASRGYWKYSLNINMPPFSAQIYSVEVLQKEVEETITEIDKISNE